MKLSFFLTKMVQFGDNLLLRKTALTPCLGVLLALVKSFKLVACHAVYI